MHFQLFSQYFFLQKQMTKSSTVRVKKLESCGEIFEKGSYHGIEILIRKSDGYVNATKLCAQFETKNGNSKEFRHIFENNSWTDFYEEFCKEYSRSDEENVFGRIPTNADFIDNCMKSYSNNFRGYYIHPKLVNYVMFWASPKYAVYVSKIMDMLNERIIITNENQSELIKNLETEIEKLKIEIEQKDIEIQTKTKYIRETSTPIQNCDKLLYILELNDFREDGSENLADNQKFYQFKLCADSTNSIKEICKRHHAKGVYKKFIIPAGMNVKQLLNRFNYKYFLDNSDLESVIEFIRANNSKHESRE